MNIGRDRESQSLVGRSELTALHAEFHTRSDLIISHEAGDSGS